MKTIRIAVPFWNDRVAPVFDTANEWYVVEIDAGNWRIKDEFVFKRDNCQFKLDSLLRRNIDVLICGALPCKVERVVKESGCEVFSFICGPIQEVLDAFVLDGGLKEHFSMPGCGRRRGRGRRGCQNNQQGGKYA